MPTRISLDFSSCNVKQEKSLGDRPYGNAQNRLLWRGIACMYLAHQEPESINIIMNIVIVAISTIITTINAIGGI